MDRPSSIKVLIVEDNPNDQELLQLQLRKTTFADGTFFLDDPLKALEMLRGPHAEKVKESLIAVFLDVHLPHMTGIDLLRILRTTEGLERLPVMIMTSSPHPDMLAACKELNVAAFVEKPVTMANFSKVISSLFHSAPAANADKTDAILFSREAA